jgi:hypothetical protein
LLKVVDRQIHFQDAIFTSQVPGLGDFASNRWPRTRAGDRFLRTKTGDKWGHE